MAEVLALDIQMMTDEEAAEIWKAVSRRADNFNEFQTFVNTRDVGAKWHITVGAKLGKDYVAKVKRNFNDAAANRTAWVTIAPENIITTDGTPYVKDTGERATFADGIYKVERKAPVVLRWKTNQHKEMRTFVEDGRKGEAEETVIDRLHVLMVATEAIKHRAPRAKKDEKDAISNAEPLTEEQQQAALAQGITPVPDANGTANEPEHESQESPNAPEAESQEAAETPVTPRRTRR